MPVSWDPDWQTSPASGTSIPFGALPTGEAIQAAVVIVGDGAELVGAFTGSVDGGWTVRSATLINPFGGYAIYQYMLTRPTSADPVAFEMTHAADGYGILGVFPGPDGYTLPQPGIVDDVSSAPLGNPTDVDNIPGSLDTINYRLSLPSGIGIVGMWSTTDAVTPPVDMTPSSDTAAYDRSEDVLTQDVNGIFMRMVAVALEGSDPALFDVKIANSSENRWLAVLSNEQRRARWWAGVAGSG